LPDGYFVPTSAEYPWSWLVLWLFLNLFQMGGDWPFVQRYLSIPTAKGARKSNYLVGVLYLITPIIWYLPAMIYRSIDANANPEQAYILMSQTVLMNGMLGVMLAAMVSATLSTVSGTLNVYANVFTYQIWGKNKKNASEKQLIGVGRKFTLIYGITIVALALLVPLMGGAEKVVVTILTMVIAPLYIPSVWGVFSRYITGKQVIWSMVITYVLGFALKFSPYKLNIHPQLLEATIGLLIPVGLMLVCEIYGRWKGLDDKGYDRIQELTDPDADVEPDATARKAVRSYSYMAISCFCITLTAIGLLLCWLLYTGQYADAAVRQIMLWACAAIALIDLSYITYRYIHRDK
jgi:Na+/proline symporter